MCRSFPRIAARTPSSSLLRIDAFEIGDSESSIDPGLSTTPTPALSLARPPVTLAAAAGPRALACCLVNEAYIRASPNQSSIQPSISRRAHTVAEISCNQRRWRPWAPASASSSSSSSSSSTRSSASSQARGGTRQPCPDRLTDRQTDDQLASRSGSQAASEEPPRERLRRHRLRRRERLSQTLQVPKVISKAEFAASAKQPAT